MPKKLKKRKKCTCCHRMLPRSSYFLRRRKGARHIMSECKVCSARRALALARSQREREGNTIGYRIKWRLYEIKHRCKVKKIPFNLTEKYLLGLWDAQGGRCYYSGLLMTLQGWKKSSYGLDAPRAFSIDRIDPAQGYVEGNVALCCWVINRIKSDLSLEEFYNYIRLVLSHKVQGDSANANTVAVRQLPADTESPCLGGSPAHD